MYEMILVPTDGSDQAAAALDHAVELARTADATVHLLYVADTNRDSVTTLGGQVVDALEAEGEQILETATDRVGGVRIVDSVETGDPVETILDYADSVDADVVVMGTHGRRGLDRYLLGSTTERVVRHSQRPVLTISGAESD
ncbi:universal stress protein [Halobellus clavatus]|uniref:Nucleotide-binding universal stress protein, UspA family n=1 Tax=Halobellus clavatus TaxID=660517 RepID=A0A1H3F0D0_9EURY|nr:universal stress protein [Halobellus clavatus]SDX84325.1 Nucleotide-binding universal stress protein, UspA family [Halobellus clavatus]